MTTIRLSPHPTIIANPVAPVLLEVAKRVECLDLNDRYNLYRALPVRLPGPQLLRHAGKIGLNFLEPHHPLSRASGPPLPRLPNLDPVIGLEPIKGGFAILRLDHFGISRENLSTFDLGRHGGTRTLKHFCCAF